MVWVSKHFIKYSFSSKYTLSIINQVQTRIITHFQALSQKRYYRLLSNITPALICTACGTKPDCTCNPSLVCMQCYKVGRQRQNQRLDYIDQADAQRIIVGRMVEHHRFQKKMMNKQVWMTLSWFYVIAQLYCQIQRCWKCLWRCLCFLVIGGLSLVNIIEFTRLCVKIGKILTYFFFEIPLFLRT